MAGSSTNVLRPRGIQVERIGANHAKVVVEPLERGFGHTLGNALRRVFFHQFRVAQLSKSKSTTSCTSTRPSKACRKT